MADPFQELNQLFVESTRRLAHVVTEARLGSIPVVAVRAMVQRWHQQFRELREKVSQENPGKEVLLDPLLDIFQRAEKDLDSIQTERAPLTN